MCTMSASRAASFSIFARATIRMGMLTLGTNSRFRPEVEDRLHLGQLLPGPHRAADGDESAMAARASGRSRPHGGT